MVTGLIKLCRGLISKRKSKPLQEDMDVGALASSLLHKGIAIHEEDINMPEHEMYVLYREEYGLIVASSIDIVIEATPLTDDAYQVNPQCLSRNSDEGAIAIRLSFYPCDLAHSTLFSSSKVRNGGPQYYAPGSAAV